jgi:hemerythrin-like domain-containing protein
MEILAELRRDHANLSRMMRLAARELDAFEAGETVDYGLLEDIMRYITGYSDVHHHPAEDLVYDALGRISPDAARDVASIIDEHAVILELGKEFLTAIESVEEEAIVPRGLLLEKGRRYLEALGRHMHTEESRLFPLAEKQLAADVWHRLEEKAARPPDPLFGPSVEQDYANLRHRIEAHST